MIQIIEVKVFPNTCPACSSDLQVSELSCTRCTTKIQGQFALPEIMQLNSEEQKFLIEFLKASGSLKEMSKILGFSYPKVRNMLDEIIQKVQDLNKPGHE